jgi:hypothetical protein
LPAFGRELLDIRVRGLVPARSWCNAHVLIVVDNWSIARNRWRLVVAPEADPERLDFSGCAGLDCIIIHDSRSTEPARLDAAIRSVLRGLPSSLATFNVVAPHVARLIKSRAVGIELAEFA